MHKMLDKRQKNAMADLMTYFPITDPTWIFFVVLGVILFAPMLLERLRIPSIVGMILAGIIIGPHGLHLLERDDSFELFGKVGLYYIMFLASLEMNLQDVQKIKGRAGTLGLLSFAIPITIGMAANHGILGYGITASVLMAAMYASHTLISYPIVLRYGISRRQSVSIAVGGTIVADTLTLLVLAVVGGMFKEGVTGLYWVWLVIKVIALGLIIIFIFPRIGRWFFRRYDDAVVQYIFVMALVFLGAGLMEIVGMEGILGAFLVGIVLNRLIPPSSPLMNHIEFVGNALFIPYFLIGVGMIINLGAFFTHIGAVIVALVMIAVALSSKWLAVFCTQKIFKLSSTERELMFGLTNSRAAATLAIVMVGYQIILPDGSHLFDEDVMNGTMMLILVTCIVSSLATERAAHKLATAAPATDPGKASENNTMLIALSNPETVAPLVNVALMLRPHKSNEQLAALNVVVENDSMAREQGVKELEHASKIAAAANVRLQTHSRWAVNVVSGLSHAMKEMDAADLLIGLHQKTRISETFYGKLGTDLLTAVRRQVLIYRAVIPINTIRRIHVLAPRKAEFEPGFSRWADRIAQLAAQVSCRVEVYSSRQTLKAIDLYWEKHKYSLSAEFHEFNEWHDMISLAHRMRQDEMIVFIAARTGMLSFHNYMNRMPEQIERYFSARNIMIVYPEQYGPELANATTQRTGVPVKSC